MTHILCVSVLMILLAANKCKYSQHFLHAVLIPTVTDCTCFQYTVWTYLPIIQFNVNVKRHNKTHNAISEKSDPLAWMTQHVK